MKKFAYVFPLCGKLQWSGEDEKTVMRRADNEKDKNEITEFLRIGPVGSFMSLTTGEMIFRTH